MGDHLVSAIVSFFVALLLGGLLVADSGSKGGTAHSASLHPQHTPKPINDRVHLDSWPDGVSAWTVVLASAPTHGQAEASLDLARRISSRGLNLGVLRSDDYVDLDSGYWVAFAGQFDDVGEAQREADRYRGLFPTSYQRFIEESSAG
ncbi:MAG TPA: hypothetical protein VGO13_05375 [Solirubrobacterales bacterium]|nr:hypothetical protein [Solirubrobacterales bacterium]